MTRPTVSKRQKHFRINRLTTSQLDELREVMEMTDTESMTLGIDRLYRDLCNKNPDVMEAVRYFTNLVHRLESTSVDKWPVWSGEDINQIEALLYVLAKDEDERKVNSSDT